MSATPALAERAPHRPDAANDAAPVQRSLLRFITCGSVDDGKSTLIGRLLLETGVLPDDTLATLKADSARMGKADGTIDYALLVDGLQAEREQGITIDVAYRYFATPRRSFIVADTPGHEQYTRNMATAASGAELAVILVDATKGVLAQTRRHSFIMSLVGVRHVVVAVNKMDGVGFSEDVFRRIEADYRAAVAGLGFASLVCIPLSARNGDNIATRSERMAWSDAPTLIDWLEAIDVEPAEQAAGEFVMPVQWVNRPDARFRGYAGSISQGAVRPGDAVIALPSHQRVHITRIVTFDGDLAMAGQGQAVTLSLDADIDVSRGDVLVAARQPLSDLVRCETQAIARILVTADRTLKPGDSFQLRLGTATAGATLAEIIDQTDISDFASNPAGALTVNGIGRVRLTFDRPVCLARYADNRDMGALILIDRLTDATAAMGVIVSSGASHTRVTPMMGALRRTADKTMTRSLGQGWRLALWPAVSWRLGSAALLALIVYGVSGHATAAVLAGVADGVGRPVLRDLHGTIWRRLRSRKAGSTYTDAGGGI